MTRVEQIVAMIRSLTSDERDELHLAILGGGNVRACVQDKAAEERFASGRACPFCGGARTVRNGHRRDGAQRYLCRDCKRSFCATTGTAVYGTRKDYGTWERFVNCMMLGLSLRKCAEVCGIHRNTAFYWRHKVLDALTRALSERTLAGIVEVDETFFPVSYKGNHKRNLTFEMPRKPRRRGKQTHVRGISHEKVCVPCAVDGSGGCVSKATNLGRVSTDNVRALFEGRIATDSVMVTDKMSAYLGFANKSGIKLVQVKGGKAKRGMYSVQRVNGYHSRLGRFMRGFNGVSTKHLNNYLSWSALLNGAREADAEKRNVLMRVALTMPVETRCRDFCGRGPLPA